MPTRLEDRREFACSAERLRACWTDPAFQEARSRHLGAVRQRCEVRAEGEELVVRLDERRLTGFPTEPFETVHTTRWFGLEASWTLEQTGGPGAASAEGSIRLEPLGDARCRLVSSGMLVVDVPRFGRWIERAARLAFAQERRKEARFIERWLRSAPE